MLEANYRNLCNAITAIEVQCPDAAMRLTWRASPYGVQYSVDLRSGTHYEAYGVSVFTKDVQMAAQSAIISLLDKESTAPLVPATDKRSQRVVIDRESLRQTVDILNLIPNAEEISIHTLIMTNHLETPIGIGFGCKVHAPDVSPNPIWRKAKSLHTAAQRVADSLYAEGVGA